MARLFRSFQNKINPAELPVMLDDLAAARSTEESHCQSQTSEHPSFIFNDSTGPNADTQEETKIKELMNLTVRGQKRSFQVVEMLLYMAIPLVGFIILFFINMCAVIDTIQNNKDSNASIEKFLANDRLISSLQKERGLSALYISAESQDLYQRLNAAKLESDQILRELNTLYPTFDVAYKTLKNGSSFKEELENLRNLISNKEIDFVTSSYIYTNLTKTLIENVVSATNIPDEGALWELLVSAASMLSISDALGLQRALGSTYFSKCKFNDVSVEWFTQLDGVIESQKSNAFLYHADSKRILDEMLSESNNPLNQVMNIKAQIHSPIFSKICPKLSKKDRLNRALAWFNTMTIYIDNWEHTRVKLLKDIQDSLDKYIRANYRDVLIHSALMCAFITVFVVCIRHSINHSKGMRNITRYVAAFGNQMKLKSHELFMVKSRYDLLLHQMLPRRVADQLKVDGRGMAEHFDSVTIHASEIVSFAKLSVECRPIEVITILKTVYSVFDSCVGRYNVYKVETIGDSHTVVSGLPDRFDNHAEEICRMSLELLNVFSDLEIPHRPGNMFKLRIGIHSGPCVAGVVDLKMPRYCLLGDTATTAARMKTTGKPLKIHISESTADRIKAVEGFAVTDRGHVKVKGKRLKKTFWLSSEEL